MVRVAWGERTGGEWLPRSGTGRRGTGESSNKVTSCFQFKLAASGSHLLGEASRDPPPTNVYQQEAEVCGEAVQGGRLPCGHAGSQPGCS